MPPPAAGGPASGPGRDSAPGRPGRCRSPRRNRSLIRPGRGARRHGPRSLKPDGAHCTWTRTTTAPEPTHSPGNGRRRSSRRRDHRAGEMGIGVRHRAKLLVSHQRREQPRQGGDRLLTLLLGHRHQRRLQDPDRVARPVPTPLPVPVPMISHVHLHTTRRKHLTCDPRQDHKPSDSRQKSVCRMGPVCGLWLWPSSAPRTSSESALLGPAPERAPGTAS